MNARLAILTILIFLLLPACGVLEVGLEEPPPHETATTLPHAPAFPPTVTFAPTQPADFDPLPAGQKIILRAIDMQDKLTGWGIGQIEGQPNDYLLVTSDGGRSWRNRTPRIAHQNPPSQGLNATAFFGPDGLAWAIFTNHALETYTPSEQVVWRTADYGQTWQAGAQLPLEGLPGEFFVPDHLGFLDARHGWLMAHLGAGMSHDYIAIFLTDEGGQTWRRVLDPKRTPTLMACPKTGLAFSNPQNGWLTGDCPGLMPGLFLYSARDGGETWQPVSLPVPSGQPADLFGGERAGCGVPGLAYTGADAVLFPVRCSPYSGGQASAWLYAAGPAGAFTARALPLPYGNLQFINPREGWFIGAQTGDPTAPGEIYHTVDGGLNWKLVLATGWQGTPHFVDSMTGWVIARAGEKTALVYTANGGVFWEEINAVVGKD
ncbi:MAG: hypothetical protein Fur0016_02350 [Anaerolineales bacterium]